MTSLADSGAGTLRDAIAAANNGDVIQFDPSLQGGTVDLTSSTLLVNKSITIEGPGPGGIAIGRDESSSDPVNCFGIFTVPANVNVTISGVTIEDGEVPGWQG